MPALLTLIIISFATFVILQFSFKDKKWNLAVSFFDWAKTTYFGTYVGDYIHAIDLAFAAIVGWMTKKWIVNPFNKEQNTLRKMDLVQQYVKNNHLE